METQSKRQVYRVELSAVNSAFRRPILISRTADRVIVLAMTFAITLAVVAIVDSCRNRDSTGLKLRTLRSDSASRPRRRSPLAGDRLTAREVFSMHKARKTLTAHHLMPRRQLVGVRPLSSQGAARGDAETMRPALATKRRPGARAAGPEESLAKRRPGARAAGPEESLGDDDRPKLKRTIHDARQPVKRV